MDVRFLVHCYAFEAHLEVDFVWGSRVTARCLSNEMMEDSRHMFNMNSLFRTNLTLHINTARLQGWDRSNQPQVGPGTWEPGTLHEIPILPYDLWWPPQKMMQCTTRKFLQKLPPIMSQNWSIFMHRLQGRIKSILLIGALGLCYVSQLCSVMQLYLLATVMLSVSITGIKAFAKSTSSRYVINRMLSMRGLPTDLN